MTRKFSLPGDSSPFIDKDSVLEFFEKRAKKVDTLGATRAVIYQDKNLDLAERRDAAEKALLFPLINLSPIDRVLDAGCGTGRWAEVLITNCAHYHGVDVSPGLIRVASGRFGSAKNATFSVCTLDELSLQAIGASQLFSRVISLGVFIYLNDEEVRQALHRIAMISAQQSRILFREPVGIDYRLTLKEHYSVDMDQHYSAIYRTEAELMAMFDATLRVAGFQMIDSGDVYGDSTLNNRAETKQRFFVFER